MKDREPVMSEEQRLAEQIRQARMVFICGNGGSASTAEHFATDLVKKGYPAIALSSNTSIITMIANDYGYDQIFSKQLEVYGTEGENDLLITISCSGISPNIINAQKLFVTYYAFETFGEDRNYGKLEDKHLAFAHEVAGLL